MEQKSLQYNLVSVKKLTAYLNSLDALPIKDLKDEKLELERVSNSDLTRYRVFLI